MRNDQYGVVKGGLRQVLIGLADDQQFAAVFLFACARLRYALKRLLPNQGHFDFQIRARFGFHSYRQSARAEGMALWEMARHERIGPTSLEASCSDIHPARRGARHRG